MINVEIDPHSGFCGGVINAISSAEKHLEEGGRLYSLGAIVHNESELERLSSLGLVPLDIEDLYQMEDAAGASILIRAHGQPPKVYRRLRELGFDIIDCTCPVVLNIQKSIRETCARMAGSSAQILLFGKVGHPEVLGLIGQIEDYPSVKAIILESLNQTEEYIESGLISHDVPTALFSQTTKSPVEYEDIISLVLKEIPGVDVHRTVCRQVASRHGDLERFARTHDVVVFVSGKTSSNGSVLSSLCRSVNIRTYHIGSIREIQPVWFRQDDSVGVCGATSTPRWLLEKVAGHIRSLV